MRRIAVVAAVLGAVLVTQPSPAATVKVTTQQNINGGVNNPGVSSYFIMFNQYEERELLTNATTSSVYTCVSVSAYLSNVWQFDYACGPLLLTFDLDPALAHATLTGTVNGNQGPVTVNVSWLASRVDGTLPSIAAEVVPTPPQEAGAELGRSRSGRISGSVTSVPTGMVVGANGYAFVSEYRTVRATV